MLYLFAKIQLVKRLGTTQDGQIGLSVSLFGYPICLIRCKPAKEERLKLCLFNLGSLTFFLRILLGIM